MILLLASIALGAVIIWSLSNQQLLLPSAITPSPPVAQLSQLPKRLDVAVSSGSSIGGNASHKTHAVASEKPPVDPPSNTTPNTTPNTTSKLTVAEAQFDVAPVVDTPVNAAPAGDPKIEVVPSETIRADLAQLDFAQVELVEAEAEAGIKQADVSRVGPIQVEPIQVGPIQAGREQATLAQLEDPVIDVEPPETPAPDMSDKLRENELPNKLAQDNLLLAELTAAGQRAVAIEPPGVTPLNTLPETAFEKLRREELALLATHSEKLQIDPKLDGFESVATSQLFQIFDLLFLYSETPVSVTVNSNDAASTLRNIMLSQQRGDQIVDYLVLSGLNRSRFKIIAESSAELVRGSHRIAIQATLDQ